jgi:hypothetical protein
MLGIEGMLARRERMGRGGASALPTARYRKEGSCYVKNFAGGFVRDTAGVIISLVPLSLLLSLRARAPYINPIVFGAAAFAVLHVTRGFAAFFFRRVRSVSIDTSVRELRVKRGIFGWGGVRVYPFSSVKCFEVFWRSALGANSSGRNIALVMDGTRETVEVIPNGRQGKEVADEMRFLAGMFGLDPVRDITYKRRVINIFAD